MGSRHGDNPHEDQDHVIQQDVQFLILDYLAYSTTELLLASLKPEAKDRLDRDEEQRHIELFDAYMKLCTPGLRPMFAVDVPPSISLRLQLLKFVASYHTYCHPALADKRFNLKSIQLLRLLNKERSKLWWDMMDEADHAWTKEELQLRVSIFRQLKQKQLLDEGGAVRHDLAPTLHDLIPAFIELTIAWMLLSTQTNVQEGGQLNVRPEWLRLVAEMMLQASLDDLSLQADYDGSHHDKFREAFSWGFVKDQVLEPCWDEDDMDIDGEKHDSEHANRHRKGINSRHSCPNCRTDRQQVIYMNTIFQQHNDRDNSNTDETADSGERWLAIRREYMMKLPEVLLARVGESPSSEHSRMAFHQLLLTFLNGLLGSMALPLLSQLECTSGNDEEDPADIWLEDIELTSDESARLRAIAGEFGAVLDGG